MIEPILSGSKYRYWKLSMASIQMLEEQRSQINMSLADPMDYNPISSTYNSRRKFTSVWVFHGLTNYSAPGPNCLHAMHPCSWTSWLVHLSTCCFLNSWGWDLHDTCIDNKPYTPCTAVRNHEVAEHDKLLCATTLYGFMMLLEAIHSQLFNMLPKVMHWLIGAISKQCQLMQSRCWYTKW